MDGIIEFLKRRATSTFLVSYTVFWLMYHWEGLATLFTTSQDYIMAQYNMLKNEYLAKYFFGLIQLEDWDWGVFTWKVLGFLIPVALAYLYVWWLPKWVLNPSYKREVNYKIDRRIIKNEAEKRLNESETQKVESKKELLQKQEEVHNMNPEEEWRLSFEESQSANKDLWIDALTELKSVIYDKYGWLRDDNGYNRMTSDELMFCDTYELIEFDTDIEESKTGRISLTDKGKFFLKEYSRYFEHSEKH